MPIHLAKLLLTGTGGGPEGNAATRFRLLPSLRVNCKTPEHIGSCRRRWRLRWVGRKVCIDPGQTSAVSWLVQAPLKRQAVP